MSSYHISEGINLTGTFKTSSGTLVDPGPVVLWIREPDGTETDYAYDTEVSKVSTGLYRMKFNPTQSGLHVYWFTSVGGSPECIEYERFYVVPDP